MDFKLFLWKNFSLSGYKKEKNFKEGSEDISLKSLCLLNFSNWKVIQSNLTYEQAQNLELHQQTWDMKEVPDIFKRNPKNLLFFNGFIFGLIDALP